jgi:TfoX/Sxy family transcriptional regulator of competence genes
MFDEALAERVRDLLTLRGDLTERKMFGGIAWMVSGNMACGVLGEDLIVRLEPAEAEEALREEHTRVFDFTGRPAKGMVVVEPAATSEPADLAEWVEAGVGFASSLPERSRN